MSGRHRTAATVLVATLLVGAVGTVWLLVTGALFAVALVLVGIPLGIGGAVALYVRRVSRRQDRIESGFRDRRAMVLGERYLDVTTVYSQLEAAHEDWTPPETPLDIVADELDAVGIAVDPEQAVVSIEGLEDPSLDRLEQGHDDVDEAVAVTADSFGAYAATTRGRFEEIADEVSVSLETQTTDPKTIDDCRALSDALVRDREALEAALADATAYETPADSTRSALETAFANADTETATDTDSKPVEDDAVDDPAVVAPGPPQTEETPPEAAIDEDEAAEDNSEQTADPTEDFDDRTDESEIVDEDADDHTGEPVDEDDELTETDDESDDEDEPAETDDESDDEDEPAETDDESDDEDEPAETDESQQEPVVAFPVTDAPPVTHPALAGRIEAEAEQTGDEKLADATSDPADPPATTAADTSQPPTDEPAATDTDAAESPADSDAETAPAEQPDSPAEPTDSPAGGSAPLETLAVARKSAGPGTSEAIEPATALLNPAPGDEQPPTAQTAQSPEKAPDEADTDSGEQPAAEQVESSEPDTAGADDETDVAGDESPDEKQGGDTPVEAATQQEELTADSESFEDSAFVAIADDVRGATNENEDGFEDDDDGESETAASTAGILYTPDGADSQDEATDDDPDSAANPLIADEDGTDDEDGYVLLGADDAETDSDETDVDVDPEAGAADSVLLGGDQPTEQEAATTPAEEDGDDTEDTVLSLGDSEADDGAATNTATDDTADSKKTGKGENADESDADEDTGEHDEENEGPQDDKERVDDDSDDTAR